MLSQKIRIYYSHAPALYMDKTHNCIDDGNIMGTHVDAPVNDVCIINTIAYSVHIRRV